VAVPVRNGDGCILGTLSVNGAPDTTKPDMVLPAMQMLAQTFVRVFLGAQVRHMSSLPASPLD
jgi:DNA-binding IclR family transcriptional regulator